MANSRRDHHAIRPASKRLAACGWLLLGSLNLSPAATAATSAEVCQSNQTPGGDWTCLAPPSLPTGSPPGATRTTFWVPRCTSGPLRARVTTPGITFVLLNTDATRMLAVNGHATGADILVGSPNTSDVLSGLRGSNTYVVGGSSGYLLGSGDRAFTVHTSSESDWVNLTSPAAEYIYINAAGQGDPGLITTATSTSTAVPVRGSNELASFAFGPCPAVSSMLMAPAAVAPAPRRPPSGVPTRPPSADVQLAGQASWRSPFPGAPTLRGFSVGPNSQQRILLSADQFRFLGDSLAGRPTIPVHVVDGVPISPSRLVTPQQRSQLQAEAKGLRKVASPVAPLVYFSRNGLLVFSQNAEPLGSSRNPGRVIARLLDRDGSPVVLRKPQGQPFYSAKFVQFTSPAQTRPLTLPPR